MYILYINMQEKLTQHNWTKQTNIKKESKRKHKKQTHLHNQEFP